MPTPERIGRYRVLGELGRGAMGVVYRARDESLERDLALKVMTKGAADPVARARFQREARAAARLQHPNIVVVYELGEHEHWPYMALELLEGMDLQRAIEDGIRPDPRRTLPLVLQILAGLGHAHEHGIVHRDVKPSNVFLPLGRPIKIMDFGVARLSGAGATTAGTLTGTPSYMSPEQVSGEEIDGRSDLFSVGLILYELVTGEKAIQAESVASTLYKILHETPDLSLLPPEWRRLRSVLERSLARKREERFADARAMSAELELALAELGGSAEGSAVADERLLLRRRRVAEQPPAPPSPVPHPPRPVGTPRPPAAPSRIRRLLPLGALGLAVLAGAVWIAGRAVRPPLRRTSAPVLARPVPSSPPVRASGSAPAAPVARSPGEPVPAPEATPSPGSPAAVAATPAGAETGLDRARAHLARSRWPEALATARAVLERAPTNAEAAAIAQQAESEIVIEECMRNARAALRQGDRERALEEVRRGFLVRKNDPRLLQLHREAVQQ